MMDSLPATRSDGPLAIINVFYCTKSTKIHILPTSKPGREGAVVYTTPTGRPPLELHLTTSELWFGQEQEGILP